MTSKTGAALSIDIKIGNECRITIKHGRGPPIEVESELSQTQLKSIHKKLREDLEEFRSALAEAKQYSLRHVINHLLMLQRRGRLILGDLFMIEPDKLTKAVENVQRCLWEAAGLGPRVAPARTDLGQHDSRLRHSGRNAALV